MCNANLTINLPFYFCEYVSKLLFTCPSGLFLPRSNDSFIFPKTRKRRVILGDNFAKKC